KLDPGANNLQDGKIADGAVLLSVDPDQFIFKIIFTPFGSQLNDFLVMTPSALASKETGETDMPSADIRQPGGGFMLHAGDGLSRYHRFSTVLSLATASPQGLDGMHKVTVSPAEAGDVLPPLVAGRIKDGTGPIHQIFVGPEVMTADFAWLDSDADNIEDCVLEGTERSATRLIYPEHLKNVAVAM